jgi:hypothetical protein
MTVSLIQRRPAQMAGAAVLCSLALLLLGLLLMLWNNSLAFNVASYLFIFNAFMPVGWLIATRRPENTIGWLFLLISMTTNLSWVMLEYAWRSLITAPGSLPGGDWVAWLAYLPQTAAWILMFTSLLLFPTGRPLTRGWGIFIWANIIFYELGVFLGAGAKPSLNYFPDIPSPLYFEGLSGLSAAANGITGAVNIAALAIIAVLRFRTANSVEKQQLKWFTYGVLLMTIGLPVVESVANLPQDVLDQLSVVGILLPVAAVAIAILRYRLYDIDIIIRRTLVYSVLTAILALIYWAGVVGLQVLLRPIMGEGNDLAVVATTLAVAAIFFPLRRFIQQFMDRRFYRRKYDTARTLEAFGQVARDEVDLDALTGKLTSVVEETVQPQHLSLWLKPRASAGKPLMVKDRA